MVQNLLKAGFELLYSIVPKTRKRTNSFRTFWSQSTRVITNLRHGNYHVINDAAVKEVLKVRTVAISG
jgi:hypothetical protein